MLTNAVKLKEKAARFSPLNRPTEDRVSFETHDGTMRSVIYLHGFASGPQSGKAQFFRRKFAGQGIAIEILRLDEGDFEHLTITRQLAVIQRAVESEATV